VGEGAGEVAAADVAAGSGFRIDWLYGFMALWLYGFMALWLYGFVRAGAKFNQNLTPISPPFLCFSPGSGG
jgi:hypothetical protein